MIACIRIQWKISRRLDDRQPVPPAVQRHLDRCPACRSFADTSARAAVQLHAGAIRPASCLDDDRRVAVILSTLRQTRAAQTNATTETPLPVLRWAAATALALALSVAAVLSHRAWSPRVASPFDHLEPVVAAVASGGAHLNDSVEQMVAVSYDTEKARIGADAEAAASFLLACLSL